MSQYASSSSQNNEKTEPITKEEWQCRLETFDIKRADMNKLIMNYLVTGNVKFTKKKSFSRFLTY